jgi:hypothetical protein
MNLDAKNRERLADVIGTQESLLLFTLPAAERKAVTHADRVYVAARRILAERRAEDARDTLIWLDTRHDVEDERGDCCSGHGCRSCVGGPRWI